MRIVLLALAVVAGLAGADIPRASVAKPAVKAPAKAARSDADIEGDIRRRFAKSKIAVDGFTVKVRGGVAILEGKTKVIQRKGVATRLARLGGARRVDNQIQIDAAARAAAAARLERGRGRGDGHGQERRRVQPVPQR
ncbi:MAG: BON domain-containing protein [Acidobacteria bacterium]|nr:BON domain-containing protein [Acidobacteriota bacterium]